jgi:hypothetical protein
LTTLPPAFRGMASRIRRGAVCRGQDRGAEIDARLVRLFVEQARIPAAA